MYSCGPPHFAEQKQDDELKHTYSSYGRMRDVALKTCQRRGTMGRSSERGSGISVLTAWHDIYIYIYIAKIKRFNKAPNMNLPSKLGPFNTPTAPLQRSKTPPNECCGYDNKQFNGAAPVILELWEMQTTFSLPLLPGPLWLGIVASDRAISMVK